ncbi:Receptor kinase-like protein xa21, partial [Thalictrum thalictroides]
YGMGSEVSTQGDVYSYGILLLEMFTRKKPTDEMFVNGLSLHNYAEMALPNQIMGIVDPLMLLEENDKVQQDSVQGRLHECLASPIRLGVTCSADLPIERMLMSQVVSELHHIRDHYRMMLGASLE